MTVMQTPMDLARVRLRHDKAAQRAVETAILRAAADEVFQTDWAPLHRAGARLSTCRTNERVLEVAGLLPRAKRINERSCKIHPLCVPCSRRRAKQLRRRLMKALNWVWKKHPALRLVMLTLTSANTPLAELGDMYARHDAALRTLLRQPRIKSVFAGTFTSIEVSIRGAADRPEAGVHSHSLLLAPADYALRAIPHAELRERWGKALAVSYLPMVHVRFADRSAFGDDASAIHNSIFEAAKYCVKPGGPHLTRTSDGLQFDPRVAAALLRGLHGRRLIRHTGLFTKALRASSDSAKGDTHV